MDWFPINIDGKPTAPDILAAHGIPFATRNNVDMVWVADAAAAAAAQALVDAYDPVPIARADAVARIKREAALRAEAAIAAADRDLLIVAALKLIAKNIASSLNASERNKLQTIDSALSPLVPIATARDAMLAQVAALADVSALQGYDETAAARWP